MVSLLARWLPPLSFSCGFALLVRAGGCAGCFGAGGLDGGEGGGAGCVACFAGAALSWRKDDGLRCLCGAVDGCRMAAACCDTPGADHVSADLHPERRVAADWTG